MNSYQANQNKWIRQGLLPDTIDDLTSLISIFLAQTKSNNIYDQSQDRKMQIQLLGDINIFIYKLKDQHDLIQEYTEEDERDDDLKRKIEQYNRMNKNNKDRQSNERRSRRNYDSRQQGRKRKVRTTITQSKLDQMNRIFSQYLQQQQKIKYKQSQEERKQMEAMEANSLKQIGQRLGLGYSTILHKFRQFRATKKVKGGALIAALQHKRKYKKSKDIQQLICNSLKQKQFYTAVELSKHIQTKYKKTLSRSIISRHLGQMGYSYKNVKNKENRNSNQIKSFRRTYSQCLNIRHNIYKRELVFYDQIVIQFPQFNKKMNYQTDTQQITNDETIHIMIMTCLSEIINFKIKKQPFTQSQFDDFLRQNIKRLKNQYEGDKFLLILDMDNQNHYNSEIKNLKEQQDLLIFYIPPKSQELNMIQFITNRLKDYLRRNHFDNTQDLKQTIVTFLQYPQRQLLQNSSKFMFDYLNKGLLENNF